MMLIEIFRCENKIRFEYKSGDFKFNHTLIYPFYINPSDEAITLIALFSRPKNFKECTIKNGELTYLSHKFMEKSINCRINVKVKSWGNGVATAYRPESGFLAFSGGFDSIATNYVLGKDVPLASVNFGGVFEREFTWFKNFETTIFEWNIRDINETGIKFNEALDWRWLLSPMLLLKSMDNPFSIYTGTIMEASSYWWLDKKPIFNSYGYNVIGNGVALICPVASITEYATSVISSKFLSREQNISCLNSVAAEGSIKKYRKKVLLAIASGEEMVEGCQERYRFGTGLADDMIALWLSWRLGVKWVLDNYCENFPANLNCDMSFFEKINTNNLDVLDDVTRKNTLKKFFDVGLKLYSADDFQYLKNATDARSKFLENMAS
ncbi:hypothetical protein [Comamonas testosteroni]|uniref:hypothetical protein n=1 Tax=Comamonas testosteroni TaxID=285 RepID=UPI0039198B87